MPKDGDVLQHNTYNTQFEPIRKECERLAEVWKELGTERTGALTQHASSEV